MNAKHTPGPWTVAPDPEYPEDSFSVYTDIPGACNAELAGRICEDANARLIAAAPALYAACELVDRAAAGDGVRMSEAVDACLLALAAADKGAP